MVMLNYGELFSDEDPTRKLSNCKAATSFDSAHKRCLKILSHFQWLGGG